MASTQTVDDDKVVISALHHDRTRSSFLLKSISRSSRNLFSGLGEVGKRLSFGKRGNGWDCEFCTYSNKNMEFLSCEMCGTIRRALACAIEDEDLAEESRAAQASAEQEKALKAVRRDIEEEQLQSIIEARMQEIIDKQRELYDQIEQKKVQHSSISILLETQRSINKLQHMLSTRDFTEKPPQPFTPNTPQRNPAPPCPPQKQPNRRSIQLARTIENPVASMKCNPWEEKATGMQDILSVQSELWNRVKSPSRETREGRNKHNNGETNRKRAGFLSGWKKESS